MRISLLVRALAFSVAALFARAEVDERKPLWLACGPAELLNAIEPLATFRRSEGLETLLVSLPPDEAIAQAPRPPDYVLIVGDEVLPRGKDAPALQPWQVRTKRLPFYKWIARQEPEFASDLAWGGIGEDGSPRIPIGRLPVRSAKEAGALAEKIVAWEKRPPLVEDLALPIWAGNPGYDPLFTALFMSFAFAQAKRYTPLWLDLWNVVGDTRNVLSGWPPAQPRVFSDRTARGGLFVSLIGHGTTDFFWSFNVKGKDVGYRLKDAQALTVGPPRPPHILFSCDCGRFAMEHGRGLAEELLLAPAGPVLCIAATNHSHPLANFYTSTSLLEALRDGPARLGPLWLRAQNAANRRSDEAVNMMLKDAEGHLGEQLDIAQVKRDQMLVYAILGDPATRLRLPRPLNARIEKTDSGWNWKVEMLAGEAQLIVGHRGSNPSVPPKATTGDEAAAHASFEKANAALAFKTLATLSSTEPWQGTIAQPGVLRLVATTPEALYVAAFELKQ